MVSKIELRGAHALKSGPKEHSERLYMKIHINFHNRAEGGVVKGFFYMRFG